jgi:hypothetical protein
MRSRRLAVVLALLGLIAFAFLGSAQEQGPPPGVDVQARGPVHEAFAEPISGAPQQGPVIAKQPPAPIEELPPDEKPAGDNVQWISGYWAWDAEANDFLWVSGFWRVPPPGRHWMPGHWQEVDTGWIWDSGFWAPDNLQQVTYLPPPPPSVENGPALPAPDATSTYVGGCWVYRDNRYLWRPGQWIAYQPGWVWIPAHYIWTPVGCLFVDGYWDHPFDARGLLFAPIRFDLAVWRAARRPFIPQFVIQNDFLVGALFVGPYTRHYYFGDYFEPAYAKRGFVAWDDFRPRKGMIDPNFAYYRHLHREEPGWANSVHKLYDGRRSGEIPRPPRTLEQQVQTINNITVNKTTNVVVSKTINLTHIQNVTALAPLKQVNNVKVTHLGGISPGKETKVPPHVMKLAPVPKLEHIQIQKAAVQVHNLGTQRQVSEAKQLSQGNIPLKHTDPPHVVKMAIPKAPAVVTPPGPAPKVTPPHPAPRVVPPPPMLPPHVVHAIPKYEPHPPPAPPKKKEQKKK